MAASQLDVHLEDGAVELEARLWRPSRDDIRAAILVAPPGLARGDLESCRWAGERLADAGYLAMATTFRDSSPYADARDLSLALDYLERQQGSGTNRFGVLGHSRGGVAALALAAADKRVDCVIAIAAAADLAEYARAVAGFAPAVGDAVFQFMGGTPEQIPERYESVRALSRAREIDQPVLLLHGGADMRVPADHSLLLERALLEAGNEHVPLEVIPGMGHFLELSTLGYQFDRVIALVCDWLAETLPDI